MARYSSSYGKQGAFPPNKGKKSANKTLICPPKTSHMKWTAPQLAKTPKKALVAGVTGSPAPLALSAGSKPLKRLSISASRATNGPSRTVYSTPNSPPMPMPSSRISSPVLSKIFKNKARRKSDFGKPKQQCVFFSRTGLCRQIETCQYQHDPSKVAICPKFLRESCTGPCLLSHKVTKNRLPVCIHFLLGHCVREVCPYPHVRLPLDAEPCKDFLNGHCEAGTACPRWHSFTCIEQSERGTCPRGAQCPLKHRPHETTSKPKQNVFDDPSRAPVFVRPRLPPSPTATVPMHQQDFIPL